MILKNIPLRILYIIPTLKKGGAERLLINIVSELQKREGVSCLIVTMHEGNDYPELSEGLPIEICTSKVKLSVLKKNKADIADFQKILDSFNPHIIHSHLFEAEILSRWIIRKETCYFSHIHFNEKQLKNINIKTLYQKKLLTNFYEKKFILNKYRQCNNNFIAVSKHTESYLKKVLPCTFNDRIHYLPNAIDFDSFYFNKTENKYNPEYNFLSIGRIDENKNHSFLIDVIKVLHNKSIKAKLDIYGEGFMKEKLEEKINLLNLSDFIKFKGSMDKIKDILPDYSLYLHAAKQESFGLVLLEAMAAGLPVVTLNGGGNSEIVADGKNGFLVESNSPELFTDKIIRLIEDKEMYNKMSVYATEFAQKYDIKNYINDLLNMYVKMIEIKKG